MENTQPSQQDQSPGGLAGAVLSVEHLGRTVDGRALVSDVSFRLLRGEVLGIMGPSGAGKSSLLRLLNRLDEPDTGRVLLEGVDTRTLPPQVLRRRIGMVMQRAFLFPGTVAENVRFGPRQRGEELEAVRVAALLAEVGLSGYADRDALTLSGGEAQRVSLARTLANRPAVLLLDEPTSALDEDSKRVVEASLRRTIAEHELSCVLVTHDPSQARRLATRVLRMSRGSIVSPEGAVSGEPAFATPAHETRSPGP